MHILIGLLIAFVIAALVARRSDATRGCRWRADRTGDKHGLKKFRCAACGATEFSATGDPPRVCKRGQP